MTKQKVVRAKAKGASPAKTNGGSLPAHQPPGKYHALALTHSFLTAPYQYIENDALRDPSVKGSIELYKGLQPNSALESVLASLIVGVSNASQDCLSQAARVAPEHVQHRDVNLRHALKGATVVTQLVEALERVRGNRSGNVSVGSVNVESGGQAIVGNLEAGQRGKDSDLHPIPNETHPKRPKAS
jgi:hypothetical protein